IHIGDCERHWAGGSRKIGCFLELTVPLAKENADGRISLVSCGKIGNSVVIEISDGDIARQRPVAKVGGITNSDAAKLLAPTQLSTASERTRWRIKHDF